MPFINLPLVNRILALSDFHRSDVVIPRLGNPTSTEPFRAAYRKTCQEPIREAIAAGNRRMISFYHQVRVHYIELEEILSYDPRLLSFFNVNTPEDLLEAERLASQEPPGSNLQ
jgi:molybdopterin-guanine dinucleotide biosynthesis protein A